MTSHTCVSRSFAIAALVGGLLSHAVRGASPGTLPAPPPVLDPVAFAQADRTDADVPAALAAARRDLRVGELTLDRIRAEFNAYFLRPNIDPAVLGDFAIYLDRVGRMVAVQRQVVEAMERAGGGQASTEPTSDWPELEPAVFVPALPESEPTDALALLDRELDDSLAKFDAYLLAQQHEALRRMEEIDEASSGEMSDLAREAAEAVERLREQGIDIDTGTCEGDAESEEQGAEGDSSGGGQGSQGSSSSGEGSTTQPAEGAEAGGTGDSGQTAGGQQGDGDGTQPAGGSGGGASGSGDPGGTPGVSPGQPDGTKPPSGDRPPADDDDIVARQLREAAEKETDPELKEKLWEEYDRYKGST